MTSENTTTWQKVTVIIAVLAVVVPVAARYSWNVVFPANYLLYEATFTTKTTGTQTASVIIMNEPPRVLWRLFGLSQASTAVA